MKTLLEMLENNKKLPMHMPGHKRNKALAPYLEKLAADCDITEIGGFDDLHSAEGILKNSMEKAADLRGAERAFYLVNGATCGILAAVCAVVSRGDTVICARNCHKSVYNALELAGAKTVFVMPERDSETGICGSLSLEAISEKIKENPDAKLIIITSPTYEGVVSDIRGICSLAHASGITVLVDAAHGAHFGFGHGFPESATGCGADIAVESLHKTMPSLTQTAVCYASGELADAVAEKLAVFETSSPSYLLMASIDGCINLLKDKAEGLFADWENNLDAFYEQVKGLKKLKILNNDNGRFFGFDRSKIVIYGAEGKWIAENLRRCGIECEMASMDYAVAMTGMGDTKEALIRLAEALAEIDAVCPEKKAVHSLYTEVPERVLLAEDAKKLPSEYAQYKNAAGRISAEYVWAYPPGIPIIIPGERISAEAAALFAQYESCGIELKGSKKRRNGKILVTK